jgi:hypothetical protein
MQSSSFARPPHARRVRLIVQFVAAFVVTWLLAAVGCGEGRPRAEDDPRPPSFGGTIVAPCTPGSSRECAIELGTRDGVVDCAKGEQTCDADGRWGGCVVGSTPQRYSRVAPDPLRAEAPGVGTQNVGGSAGDCTQNPCNPYCQQFGDRPDGGSRGPSTSTTVSESGGTLENSNVPPGFQNKGSLNNLCTQPCTTASCQGACQFDQYCGPGNACTHYPTGQKDVCNGIDITVPPTCNDGNFRVVTLCNRGSQTAPAGIFCHVYPGNSPQFPNADPGLGTEILQTTSTIAPGACLTHRVAESMFPASGTRSLMCNPPGSQGVPTTVTTTVPFRNPTAVVSSDWTNAQNGYVQDGAYASALVDATTVGPRFPTAFESNSGWTNPNHAYANNTSYATAAPAAAGGSFTRVPTTNTAVGFVNPTRAYAEDSLGATAALARPTLGAPVSTGFRYPGGSGVDSTCTGGTACRWLNINNLNGDEGSQATASGLRRNDVASVFIGNFDFGAIPANAVVTGVNVQVEWTKGSRISSLTLQLFGSLGTQTVGPVLTQSALTNAFSITDAAELQKLRVTDLARTNARLFRLVATHDSTNPSDGAEVDYIRVSVSYAVPTTSEATLTLGNFGFALPDNATITSINAEARWRVTAANPNAVLGLQLFRGATPIGAEATTTVGVSPPTAFTLRTTSPAPTGLTAADFANGTFTARIRATRAYALGDADFTAEVDVVRVTVTYSVPGALVTLGNFGINLPGDATILAITPEVNWRIDVANPHAELGLQALIGSTPLGSELATTSGVSPPTVFTTQRTTLDGATLRASDLADGSFKIRLRTTRGSEPSLALNPNFTALVNYVAVTVTYSIGQATRAVTYGNFGFAIPEGSSIQTITTEARWRISPANANATLTLSTRTGGGASRIGTNVVVTNPPTADTTVTQTLSGADTATLTPADIADGNFVVRVQATRGNGANDTFTAFLDSVRVTVAYGTSTGGNVSECNPHNNWSATKRNPDTACVAVTQTTFSPFTVTRVFDGVCPTGTAVRWRNFGYASTTPTGTRIRFRFRSFDAVNGSCVAQPAVIADPPVPLATAQLSPDTQNCSINGGTAGCPVDLFTGLGGVPAAARRCLQMDARGETTGAATAVLSSWNATYDCLPSE